MGKSDNPAERFVQHMNGKGATWTKIHKPVKVLQVIENASPFDEDKNVKEMMAKYGIDKVRGGTYVQESLSEAQEESLKKEIRAATDCCIRCGKKGHFVANCRIKETNKIPPIKSSTPVRRINYQEEFDKPKSKPPINKSGGECYRCGRKSHWSKDCYATTDIDGDELTDDEDEDEDEDDDEDEDEDDDEDEDGDDLDANDIDSD